MSPADLATIEQALSALGVSEDAAVSATEALGQLRRRDWAVRVLDAAADAFEWPPLAPVKQLDGSFAVDLIREVAGLAEPFETCGPTPDAARLAAAQAVYPELPADVRAELGECP